ncbi:MAG: SUMF1/EgtB/PvdO family nonheme iron enzyme [Epsilonproteobacteria bacterium]|nr:SUMF1/EgtB/PvdO family nonheme iron enzyme [Campylobacterota bacterium]
MVKREYDNTVSLGDNTTIQKIKSYEKMKKVFEEEAQNIVTINAVPHKNVAGFVSLERDVNNTIYYLMPYSEGEELGEYLNRLKEEGVELNQKDILALIEPILNGLEHIHHYRVYHKDIKPANIYIRQDDEPMLIDFGASVVSAHLLTPSYAPIEQVKRVASEYGPYTDIYAVGVMMHEMVTGAKPPKSKERAEAIARGERDPYQPLIKDSELGKSFEPHFLKGIDHALALAYTDRPQTAKLFREELRGDLKRKKRNRFILWFLAGLTLLSLLGYTLFEAQRDKYGYMIVPHNQNAQVLVDNRLLEPDAENRYPILLGKHSVEINNGLGYLSTVQEVVLSDEHGQKRVENQLIKERVSLEINTKDDIVAQVEIDGEFVGNTPYVGRLYYDKEGGGVDKSYKIMLRKEGYDNSETKQLLYKELMQHTNNKINFELRKKEGEIEIKSPVGFKVKVNGQVVKDSDGRVELTPLSVKQVPGVYTVLLYSSKREEIGKNKIKVYDRIVRTVTVKDRETTLFPQVKAEKNPQYLLAKVKEEERSSKKGSQKELLKAVKKPVMGKALNGVRFAKTEVTYDELVRFLNSVTLSEQELKRYFNVHSNMIAKYIKQERVEGRRYYYVYEGYENYPVIQISWYGAKAYIEWLNRMTGEKYRLPTYSEWYSVATLGFDAEQLNSYVNHKGNAVLSRVGLKKANSLGLFDIFGNVAEWSEEKSGDYSRLTLGGSYRSLKQYISPSMKSSMSAYNTKNSDIGFRVVQ